MRHWCLLSFLFILLFVGGCQDNEGLAMKKYLNIRNEIDVAKTKLIKKEKLEKLSTALKCFEQLTLNFPKSAATKRVLAVNSDPYTIFSVKNQIKNLKLPIYNKANAALELPKDGNTASSTCLYVKKIASTTSNINRISAKDSKNNAFTKEQIVSFLLKNIADNKLDLPTDKDFKENYRRSILLVGKKIVGKTVKERLVNALNNDSKDFAVIYADFNADGFKDVFIELKGTEGKFSLYYLDGKIKTFKPISFSWEIQGSVRETTMFKDEAYILELCEKNILRCFYYDYNLAWLGFVNGKIRNVSLGFIDQLCRMQLFVFLNKPMNS